MEKITLEKANKLLSVIESINKVLDNNEENRIYFYVTKWDAQKGHRSNYECQLQPEYGELLVSRIIELRNELQEEFNNL